MFVRLVHNVAGKNDLAKKYVYVTYQHVKYISLMYMNRD